MITGGGNPFQDAQGSGYWHWTLAMTKTGRLACYTTCKHDTFAQSVQGLLFDIRFFTMLPREEMLDLFSPLCRCCGHVIDVVIFLL